MMSWMKQWGAAALSAACLGCATYAPVERDERQFASAQIEEDFGAFIHFVKTTHPDLSYSADLDALDALTESISGSFDESMTLRDAWMTMALANPAFGDAHVGLRRPVEAIADYEKQGGTLFPAPMVFDDAGVMRIGAAVPDSLGLSSGAEVISINGVKTETIVDTLLPRMRGETVQLRRLVMERYFPQYFWIAYGGYETYVLRLRENGRTRVASIAAADGAGQEGDAAFIYETLPASAGYMNVKTFNIEKKDQFAAFLSDAFAQIREDGVDRLIIDLRVNGGGAHDVSDLLMAYLTHKPYSPISGIKARITEENIGRIPGAKLGDVVAVPFRQTVTPPEVYPLRFKGEVYALVGGLTYSQAIAFAATLQDHDIATIAGQETEGPANQSGQVQRMRLPHTGLEALAPIYIFIRASGDRSRRGVIPDIEIKHDPLDPMESVRALLEAMKASRE